MVRGARARTRCRAQDLGKDGNKVGANSVMTYAPLFTSQSRVLVK